MAEKALARVTRLLGIVSVLQHQDEATFEELAERFSVTPSQIRDDVMLLFTTGKPGGMPDEYIDFDPDALDRGIARLWDAQGLTQVRLSPREAVALIASLGTLVASGAAPAAAEPALAKLRAAVGSAPIDVIGEGSVEPSRIAAIREGLERGLAVTLEYVDAQDRRTDRVIEPHRLVVINGVGYIECWCRRAADYRTLRLERVVASALTQDPIETPPAEGLGFALKPRFEARVTALRSARWALEAMPGAVIVDDGEDIVGSFTVADADFVASRLLAIGPALKAIEPEELRGAVARHAREVLAAQDGAP